MLWAGLGMMLAFTVSSMAPVMAQVPPTHPSYLRIESSVEPGKGGRMRVSGYVYNTWDKWAVDVRLLVEALDAAGEVTGSTSVLVYGKVPPGNRSYFDSALTATGASYRVTVQTVDWRTYGAGGG